MRERIYSILVIDDNPADLCIIGEAFKECGYRYHLRVAASLAEAQHLLSTERFDLLLSDFGIDVQAGQRSLQSLRAHDPCLPIIILSGGHDFNSAYKAGANAFLRKPIYLQEFIVKSQRLMQFWVDVAELPTPVKSHSVGLV